MQKGEHDKMERAKRMAISLAVQQEMERNPKIKTLLYLQEHGETSAYKVAKAFGWEPSKAHSIINQLKHSQSILTEQKIINGRAVNLVKLSSD